MNIEELRDYCIEKKGVTEEFPFDKITLVFKVAGKMFALTTLEGSPSVNLKCDPEKAIELRESYPEITPGFHMNKQHWNTVRLDGLLDYAFIKELIDHSYEMVIAGLPKKVRDGLKLK